MPLVYNAATGKLMHSAGNRPADGCPEPPTTTRYLQARSCANNQLVDYFLPTGFFLGSGGQIPLPYTAKPPNSDTCVVFSSTNPQTTSPGTILVGQTVAPNCNDIICTCCGTAMPGSVQVTLNVTPCPCNTGARLLLNGVAGTHTLLSQACSATQRCYYKRIPVGAAVYQQFFFNDCTGAVTQEQQWVDLSVSMDICPPNANKRITFIAHTSMLVGLIEIFNRQVFGDGCTATTVSLTSILNCTNSRIQGGATAQIVLRGARGFGPEDFA